MSNWSPTPWRSSAAAERAWCCGSRKAFHHVAGHCGDCLHQFVAALNGGTWNERDDAIRGFARWLGFRRTGGTIEESARSLVHGLLREGRLERHGTQIRRSGNGRRGD